MEVFLNVNYLQLLPEGENCNDATCIDGNWIATRCGLYKVYWLRARKFKGYKIFNNIMDGIIKEYEIMGYHIVP